MSDLSAVLDADAEAASFTALPAWRGVTEAFGKDAVPHCWVVSAPGEWHAGILRAMSQLYLGREGWSRESEKSTGLPSHPDMIVAGDFEKPANIEACRALIKELAMKPVIAGRRLGVLPSADKLLVNAANSLLKIAEEPPSHACLLFLMEGNDFLPTLKSRSRVTALAAPQSFRARAASAPYGDGQWADWLSSFKDGDDPAELLSAWTSHFLRSGGVEAAAKADGLRLLVQQKKLSHTMVCDLLILTLKEELPFEPILGGFR